MCEIARKTAICELGAAQNVPETCSKMSLHLQTSASLQPRTDLKHFGVPEYRYTANTEIYNERYPGTGTARTSKTHPKQGGE